MTKHENLGHEPEETHDRDFAPVTRDSDARGRTTSSEEEDTARQQDEVSGTGVPGVGAGQADALPPDEDGVRDAERQDDSR